MKKYFFDIFGIWKYLTFAEKFGLMGEIVKYNDVMKKIIDIRGRKAILDSDVAELYDVETKRINEAVSNNPKKFPEGYIMEMSSEEYKSLRSKISTLEKQGRGQHVKYTPKAFTRKGCYMLATILKGDKAIDTTLAIIEAFDRLIELQETVAQLSQSPDEFTQKTLMQKGGEIFSEMLGNDLHVSDTETSFELNFALMKFKHTIKRSKKSDKN